MNADMTDSQPARADEAQNTEKILSLQFIMKGVWPGEEREKDRMTLQARPLALPFAT